jgi:hypothetical protein
MRETISNLINFYKILRHFQSVTMQKTANKDHYGQDQ